MRTLYLFLVLLLGLSVQGQEIILSPQAQVSLLTVDSGNELYALYGHTALRIKDPGQGIDEVYNYGAFDFRTPNFYLKYVKGDLQYFAEKDPFHEFLQNYVYEQRGVYEQILNLDQVQKQNIYNDLNAVLASDQRFYTYKFIDRNCTTMVADVINRHIAAPISTKISVSHLSYREILYNYQEPRYFENLGINIMFGSKTERKFDHNFLPMQLLEGVEKTVVNGKKLSDRTIILNKSTLETDIPFWNSYLTFGVLLVLVIFFSRRRGLQMGYLVTLGLLGLFILFAGLFSLHLELAQNINVLLFNPLYLLIAGFAIADKWQYARIVSYVCLGILAIYLFLLLGKVHAGMFFPMTFTTSVVLYHVSVRKERPKA